MHRRILDANVLMNKWACAHVHPRGDAGAAKKTAGELIQLYSTNATVTPVKLEFLAGSRSRTELTLMEAFLSEFTVIDKGKITDTDWCLAEIYTRRVPAGGKRRGAFDCLFRAIADRF